MSAASELRAGTRSEHDRVDALFGRLDLSSATDYGLFLRAMAAAYLPVEKALEEASIGLLVRDWRVRKRGDLLGRDLAELGLTEIQLLAAPCFGDVPAILGGIYVLEGSRLGGAFLKRSLPVAAPARFLGAPAEPGSWKRLLETIDANLTEAGDILRACEAARSVFRTFEIAGRRATGAPSLV